MKILCRNFFITSVYGTGFSLEAGKKVMENKNDVERNRPAEAGRNSDNRLRDDSAVQPGVSTVTRSDTDDANERLTKTGGRDFITKDRDPDADATFDDDSAGVGDKE